MISLQNNGQKWFGLILMNQSNRSNPPPPPGSSFIVTETGINVLMEDGSTYMITE